MIFTNLSRIVSVLLLLFGLILAFLGLSIANGWTGLPYDVALTRYAPGKTSSGEVIDKGLLYILISLALGTLAEISFAISKKHI
jgi:hypothetical protein